MQTKTIAMLLLLAIAVVGATAIGIVTVTQSAQAIIIPISSDNYMHIYQKCVK